MAQSSALPIRPGWTGVPQQVSPPAAGILPSPRPVTPPRGNGGYPRDGSGGRFAESPPLAPGAGYPLRTPSPLQQRPLAQHRPPTPQRSGAAGSRVASPQRPVPQFGLLPPPSPQGGGLRAPTPPAQLGRHALGCGGSVAEAVRQRSLSRAQSPSLQRRRGSGAGNETAYVRGDLVEYHSSTFQCWIPTVVEAVDAESGGLTLAVRPRDPVQLRDQGRLVRRRTRPEVAQLEWVSSVLRQGRLEQEAEAMFHRFAIGGVLLHDYLPAVAGDMDTKTGVLGFLRVLYSEFQTHKLSGLALDHFRNIFWDQLLIAKECTRAMPLAQDRYRPTADPQQVYDFADMRLLGEGTYGKVVLAWDHVSRDKRAVKIIEKSKHLGSFDFLAVEIDNLTLLDHPHIARLYEFMEDTQHLYLVMDLCSGGDLSQKIEKAQRDRIHLSEPFVADSMRQVLMAVTYVHARGIVHLDLKPANVMLMPNKRAHPPVKEQLKTLASDYDRPHVVVIDFGVAQFFQAGNFKHNRPCGTPYTMAPEVWSGEITPKSDVWSCGVMIFELLALRHPVDIGTNKQAEAVALWRAQPQIHWEKLSRHSQEVRHACMQSMQVDRFARPSGAQLLTLPFFSNASMFGNGVPLPTDANEALDLLTQLPQRSLLYISVALEVARRWPANHNPTVKALFTELNLAGQGRLEVRHFCIGLQRLGVGATKAAQIADAADVGRDGCIEWTTFVAACTDLGSPDFEGFLRATFCKADSDGDNLLSLEDLKTLLPASCDMGLAKEIFQGLTGRTERGARLDLPTFLGQFRSERAADALPGGAASRASHDTSAEANQTFNILGLARDQFDRARSRIFPAPGDPGEEDSNLQQLASMGFADRPKNLAALRRHRNRVTASLIEEICIDEH